MKLDSIVALGTALATQAISVLRLSGEDAIPITERLIQQSLEKADRRIKNATVVDPLTGNPVDDVLVLVMKGPRSYTREDVVEIQCHGGVYITQRLLSLVLGEGARLARPGEFTQRAVMNGRIDLAQAEAINDLVNADSEQSARLALAGMQGALSQLNEPLKEALLTIIAQIEVNIDYPEYDAEQVTLAQLAPQVDAFIARCRRILIEAQSGQRMAQGVKTAIIGQPNVGKSSLLNALLNEDKAIVTDIPGTTRDVVEGTIRLQNVTLHLMDTAGLRASDDRVEQLGIAKTRKIMDEADLILFVVDGSQAMSRDEEALLSQLDPAKVLVVYNKNDLVSRHDRLEVSALNKDIAALVEAINARYLSDQFVFKQPVLSGPRTIGLLRQALKAMENAQKAIQDGNEVDLITIDLQEAYGHLVALTDPNARVDLADELFSRFCLGK
jgi:tRNA modification GTPase